MTVSHLIIINVKDQINDDLKKILEVCADSFKHLQMQRVSLPSLFIVMNQKADPNFERDVEAIFKIL